MTDEPGFGNPMNKYSWSMTLFDGSDDGDIPELYVGTLNGEQDVVGGIGLALRLAAVTGNGIINPIDLFSSDSSPALREFLSADLSNTIRGEGPEIWKYDFETETWTQVLNAETSGGILDDEDLGLRDAVSFNGEVFFSSSTSLIYNLLNAGDNQAKIVYSSDGENWDLLEGGPLDSDGTRSIRSLTVVDYPGGGVDEKALLVGTENVENGAELWFYREDGSWEKVAQLEDGNADGDHYASAISEVIQFGNDIYVGTWFPYTLYKLTDTGLVDVTPQPDGDVIDDQGVMQLIEYDGWFYISSVNYGLAGTPGASLYRTTDPDDPTSWEVVTTDGFATELPDTYAENPATYVWQMAVVDGVLYMGDLSDEAHLLKLTHVDIDDNYTVVVAEDNGDEPFTFGSQAYGIRKMLPVALDGEGLPLPDQSVAPTDLLIGSADPYDTKPLGILESLFTVNGEQVVGRPFTASTLWGSENEDLILGGVRGDVMNGGDEDDVFIGNFWSGGIIGGGDTVNGGSGEDIMFGLAGNDVLRGDEGEDFMVGGAGRDRMYGGDGIDLMVGDFINDGPLDDIITPLLQQLIGGSLDLEGAPSLDILMTAITGAISTLEVFGGLNDVMYGNDGNDIMIGGGGRDRMFGNEGADLIYGNEGKDRIFGNAGNDILEGGEQDDFMHGGAGNDTLISGLGNDTMVGGAGDDTFIIRGGEGDVIETGRDLILGFQQGSDVIDLSEFFGYGYPFDFETHLAPALRAQPLTGWLVIDLSLITGTSNLPDPGPEGDGTIVVQGLRYADVEMTDFKVDSLFIEGGLGGLF
ncbi:calcium-binding protein [Acuticoccus kandeliae]|uniref:calcium-binding protein n=1 Tax=Acuticoccus kandeliae TaxID=2073160 RepID=UPI000D3E04D0|nr:calcium-binding protein [Acuticoccus kandeliae]